MALSEQIKVLLNDVLSLGGRVDTWTTHTPLLGSVPELDSMAVVGVLTALEEDFGFTIADEEISADMFATLGSLTAFVENKLAA
jgi:acyl carrier protein